MFGVLRFFLATLVMVAHIGNGPGYPAHYSVWAFYSMSGFLMVLVAQRKFDNSLRGSFAFLTNRFLRIFPTYWIILIISIALIFAVGEEFSSQFRTSMTIPKSARDIINNIFLFELDELYPVRIAPPTWALRIELFYYILIGILFSKSDKLIALWFILSVLYVTYLSINGNDFYYDLIGCSLAFSSGAFLYTVIDKIKIINLNYITGLFLATGIFCAWLIMVYLTQIDKYTYGLLMTTFVIQLCILILFNSSTENKVLNKIDVYLGSLSYPLYLLHWPVSLIPAYFLNLERGILCFLLSLPLVILCSHFVARHIEKPITLYRKKHFS